MKRCVDCPHIREDWRDEPYCSESDEGFEDDIHTGIPTWCTLEVE